ncbi:MAG TPA: formate dehydrogenase accessory sulfurtransferase FdhD [Bacillota bacterium]|nr:formate dehydrogenase accessory sulfurtransferase FdhD [Bacillota bacterium]
MVAEKNTLVKQIVLWRDGTKENMADTVTVEAPMTIFVNGEELVTLLCTPEDMDLLALGFLRSEGLFTSMDEVAALRLKEREGLVEVELKDRSNLARRLYGKRTITSGCGKGTVFFQALDALRSRPVKGEITLAAEQAKQLMHQLQGKAVLFRETGGVHSAAVADTERIIFFYEDIGRHNAVDKLIGRSLLEGIPLEDKILVTSGRLSSEMLLKAAKLQFPILLSRSAPTSLSVELAEAMNITLVGFVRGHRMNIYTHGWRIV